MVARRRHLAATLIACLCSIACSIASGHAVYAAEVGAGRVCLDLGEIDHTEVEDDSTVLFFMRDKTVWENLMPEACRGLKAARGFEYSGNDAKLCSNVDLIRIAEDGEPCALGNFVLHLAPATRE